MIGQSDKPALANALRDGIMGRPQRGYKDTVMAKNVANGTFSHKADSVALNGEYKRQIIG
jgi:hypothetical protein